MGFIDSIKKGYKNYQEHKDEVIRYDAPTQKKVGTFGINGIGNGYYFERPTTLEEQQWVIEDHPEYADIVKTVQTYIATKCVCILWIPIIPYQTDIYIYTKADRSKWVVLDEDIYGKLEKK